MSDRAEIEEKVNTLLNSLRTHFQADGGDINFIELTDDNVVKIQLVGACTGCAYRHSTLMGLQEILATEVPEVEAIQVVD